MRPPSTTELERLSDRAVPGLERRQLGRWVLRAGLGSTGRSNTTWPAGEPGCHFEIAVDEVEAWYRSRGLQAGFQLFDGAAPGLISELERRRYRDAPGALVLWCELASATLRHQDRDGWDTEITDRPTKPFETLVDDDDRLAETTATALRQTFVTVNGPEGELLGGGKSILDGAQLGIFGMKTLPAAQRTGVAERVLTELLAAGRRRNAASVWLQVMADNTPARRFYERAGFVEVHRYEYKFAPALLGV